MRFIYRFRYLIAIFIFIIAVGFSLHFSSISMWDNFVPSSISRNINLFGKGRSIRSDEWISKSIIVLSQTKNKEYYPLINTNLDSGMNMFLIGAPVFDLSLIGRPQYWGYFLLGAERGFSWFWWFRLLLLFFTSFELCLYLTNGRKGYALIGSILIAFSPLVQWWLNEVFIDLIIYFQLILVCLITYFKMYESNIKRVICLTGVLIGICGFAFSFFPAISLPLLLLLLVLIGAILYKEWENINGRDWVMAGCSILLALFVICFALFRSLDDIKLILTIPSAKRFLFPGSYDIRHQMFEYFSLMLPFRDITFQNNCEVSRFVTLMPLTLLMFPLLLAKVRSNKKQLLFQILIYVLLIILCIWAYVPMPSKIGKLFSWLTLLFSTTRIHIIIGLFGVYLLIIIFVLREKVKFSIYEKVMLSILALCCILYALYTPQIKEYLKQYITPIAIFYLLVMFLLIWGKPKWAAVILGICVLGSGLSINPVAKGLTPIYDKPISKEIEKISNEEPHARWLIMTDLFHSYLPALGVNCFNTVQLNPFLDQWELFDPDEKYINIYNRYCFVRTSFTEKETYFEINHPDVITLYLNTKDLYLTKTKYIFTDTQLELWNNEQTNFKLVYLDPFNNYRIYQIE